MGAQGQVSRCLARVGRGSRVGGGYRLTPFGEKRSPELIARVAQIRGVWQPAVSLIGGAALRGATPVPSRRGLRSQTGKQVRSHGQAGPQAEHRLPICRIGVTRRFHGVRLRPRPLLRIRGARGMVGRRRNGASSQSCFLRPVRGRYRTHTFRTSGVIKFSSHPGTWAHKVHVSPGHLGPQNVSTRAPVKMQFRGVLGWLQQGPCSVLLGMVVYYVCLNNPPTLRMVSV